MSDAATAIKVSRELRELCNTVDDRLRQIAGERVGFSLIVYTAPRASYMSSVEREQAVKAIKELLDYWESGGPDVPAHEV